GDGPGLVFEFLAPPAPDVLVRGARLAEFAGAGVEGVAVEHTENHPAAWGNSSYPRKEVDSRWQSDLLPAIEAARRTNPVVKSISASFDFKDIRLPRNRDHQAIAADLVRVVEAMVQRIPDDRFVKICFSSRDVLAG